MADIVQSLTTAMMGSQMKRDVASARRKKSTKRMVMFRAQRTKRRTLSRPSRSAY